MTDGRTIRADRIKCQLSGYWVACAIDDDNGANEIQRVELVRVITMDDAMHPELEGTGATKATELQRVLRLGLHGLL